MKIRFIKRKSSGPEIQENNAAGGDPEIQDSKISGDGSEASDGAASEDGPKPGKAKFSEIILKLKTASFLKIFRKAPNGKAAEGVREVQETISENVPETPASIISEDVSEAQDVTVSEEAPKPKSKFFGLFGKLRGRKSAEGTPEVQETISESVPETPAGITSEDVSESHDVTVSKDAPKLKEKFFGLLRKLRGRKAAGSVPEVQETIAADSIPEVKESVVSEEIPEVQEVTISEETPKPKTNFFGLFRKAKGKKAAEGVPEVQEPVAAESIPEVKESEAAEVTPEVQEIIAEESIPEVQAVAAAEETQKPKSRFFGLFRKAKDKKAAEGVPEIQEAAEAAEAAPEVQEPAAAESVPETPASIISEEISKVTEGAVPEETPKPKSKFFGLFRKAKGKKAAEGVPEVQESEAAEVAPEVQETIAAEVAPEVQETTAAEVIPEELPEAPKEILLVKKKPWSLAKKIVVPICSVIVLALLTGGLFFAKLYINPLGGIETIADNTNTPAPSVLPEPSESSVEVSATPSPTLDPFEVLKAKADFSKMKGIVNILLIGVDHGDERDSGGWSGKHAWHSDVMIVVSINTNTNKVSLISLPRDTYAKIPGVDGIYKLNASINCGGGWPKPEAFQKVCDAASWMIGGMPIQYYYAVDFNAVKGLVDAVGGVDNFNVDITFKINGRSYTKGVQKMNGQAALDYMRVRKDAYIAGSGDDGDLNRINRQKAMLVAIFDKLKSTGNIAAIPDILGAFEGNLYTNAQLPDTAAFAAYAYQNIDPKSISVYSMGGKYAYKLFDFNFVITDLSNRVRIIKTVYGIDISKDKQYKDIYEQYKKYSADRAWDLWYDMQTNVALKKSKKYLDQIKKKLDEDAAAASLSVGTLAEGETSDPPVTDPPKTDPPKTDPPATDPPTSDPPTSDPPTSPTTKPSGGGKFGDDIRALYQTAKDEYNKLDNMKGGNKDTRGALIAKYKADVQRLCTVVLSFKWNASKWESFWQVIYNAKSKGGCNQHIVRNDIYVDFR